MPTTTLQGKTLSTVDLNWKEVFYTNCGMVSASNVDQELTWCRTDFAAIGVDYAHLLSRRENDWYIQRDFDVHAWAAPEFLERAAKELIEERWTKATAAKLPQATVVRLG